MSAFGKYAEELELSYFAGRNVKWYTHFGKQYLCFLKCETQIHHVL